MPLTQRIPIPAPRLAVAAAGSPAPTVWLMLGRLAGDNAQLLALGRALGWPCVIKRVVGAKKFRFLYPDSPPRPAPGEAPLEGPWPDLVIGVGGLGARAGHWVKRQSGGRTRHVQVGKIDGGYDWFDLIVTTRQYELPPADNVIHLTLPIVHPDRDALAASATVWTPEWSSLPRPWIGVLVGGPSWPIAMSRTDSRRLIDEATAFAHRLGGSLLIAAGPRTPEDVIEELRASDCPHARFYPFQRGADNPYPALLALCDQFIVTSDSVSMVTDACWTGRPVALFELPIEKVGPGSPTRRWRVRRRRRKLMNLPPDLLDCTYDIIVRKGWWSAGRNVPAMIETLKTAGWVQALGAGALGTPSLDQLTREVDMVVERIWALMA